MERVDRECYFGCVDELGGRGFDIRGPKATLWPGMFWIADLQRMLAELGVNPIVVGRAVVRKGTQRVQFRYTCG